MKKPINKFAIALWVAAATYAVGNLWYIYDIVRFASDVQHIYSGNTGFFADTFWKMAETVMMVCSQLVALGILIEMVDQIRWKLEQRQ